MTEHLFRGTPQYDQQAGFVRQGRWMPEEGVEDVYFAEDSDIDVAALLLAMEQLTERQRFVVECRFGLRRGSEGVSLGVREIARLLGVHHSTVEEHERAGLAKLRALLATTAPPPPASTSD